MTKSERAISKMVGGYNCAQAVFSAFCDDLGIDENTALKLASGFGAGMARKQEVCGAVTGGILVLSAKHGRGENDDRTATESTYAKTRQFMDQFAGKHGTCLCRDLLHCDLTTEEGRKVFTDQDLTNKVCRPCVRSAVEIVEKIM